MSEQTVRTLTGKVVSDKMDKSIVVPVSYTHLTLPTKA